MNSFWRNALAVLVVYLIFPCHSILAKDVTEPNEVEKFSILQDVSGTEQELIKIAENEYKSKNYKKASQVLELLVKKLSPKNADIVSYYRMLGSSYLHLQDIESAENAYMAGLSLNNKNAKSHELVLALIYAELGFIERLRKNPTKAIEYLEKSKILYSNVPVNLREEISPVETELVSYNIDGVLLDLKESIQNKKESASSLQSKFQKLRKGSTKSFLDGKTNVLTGVDAPLLQNRKR